MRNPLVTEAATIVRAVSALKLRKGDYWESHGDGVLIVQRGKPDLVMTFEAARAFVNQIHEAESQ